jgi:hypothetical protein
LLKWKRKCCAAVWNLQLESNCGAKVFITTRSICTSCTNGFREIEMALLTMKHNEQKLLFKFASR